MPNLDNVPSMQQDELLCARRYVEVIWRSEQYSRLRIMYARFLGARTNALVRAGSYNEWTVTPEGTLQTKLPSKMCATVQKDKTVILAKCIKPVPAEQKWKYV